MISKYLRKNWIIYSLLASYTLLLGLNAAGFDIWLPSCIITSITGYNCFGCGLSTAAIHLLRLDFHEAFVSNPLIYLYVFVVIGWIVYDFYNFRKKQSET